MNLVIFYMLANAAVYAACFVAGRAAAKISDRAGNAFAFAGLVVMSAQLVLYFNAHIEYSIFTAIDYIYFRWWCFCGIFAVLGAGFDRVRARNPRLPVLYVILAFSAVAFVYRLTLFNAGPDYDESDFFKGLCFQSTGYTCGPASCVTLLRSFGVKATEKEMARECLTMVRGTEDLGIARGLRVKLDPAAYEVHLTREGYEGLLKLPRPFITTFYLSDSVLHAVTVFDVDSAEVRFADSLACRFRRLKKDEFVKAWTGFVIWVSKK